MEARKAQGRKPGGESAAAVIMLDAEERCLRRHGFAGLFTRMVAAEAGT
jgi:DNA-binding transcriptional regulator YbjK